MQILKTCSAVLTCWALSTTIAHAQSADKVSVNGSSRALFYADDLTQEIPVADTITAPKENSGHTLVDLGINIRPLDHIEIQGMVRVRNDFGGFWGSGITFDLRQLYVKGVIADVVRYQLGDIDYVLTPFTMYNGKEYFLQHTPGTFEQFQNTLDYDMFFNEHGTRRQQGASVDFALTFADYVDELQFSGMTSRQQPAAAGQNERLFSAANITLVQSKYVRVGYNFANLYDILGTSKNTNAFRNPVHTISAAADLDKTDWKLSLEGESGASRMWYTDDAEAPAINDYFIYGKGTFSFKPFPVSAAIAYTSVGPDFRSPGAQTKQVDFNAFPRAYDRFTNDQVLRPFNYLDLLRDAAIYNMGMEANLMDMDPRYDNITPYGQATPNRQGITGTVNYKDKKDRFSITAAYLAQTEIRGQGTNLLRQFSRLSADLQLNAGSWFEQYKKSLVVDVHMHMDNTTRDAEGNVPGVDLQTNIISANLAAETCKQLDILFGMQLIQYSGFEFAPLRDDYGQILYFNPLETDGSELIAGGGLRYRFTNKISTSAVYSNYASENTLSTLPNYTIGTFAFIFKMDF